MVLDRAAALAEVGHKVRIPGCQKPAQTPACRLGYVSVLLVRGRAMGRQSAPKAPRGQAVRSPLCPPAPPTQPIDTPRFHTSPLYL